MCVLCTILAQESSLTCKPAGEGVPVVMCVIMVNFYVLLELSEKLALEARLFPYSYLRPMFVSKSLPRPFCLEMGWQPKVFDRTDKTAQKSKHHVPENSWKVNNFQQMLALFIPCYKSVCSGEEVWEAQPWRKLDEELQAASAPQSVSAGCKLLNSQHDLCLLLSTLLPGSSTCGHPALPATLREELHLAALMGLLQIICAECLLLPI